MFELEVNCVHKRKSDLAPELVRAFESENTPIEAVSVLQWEEHCTECAMPQCYSTCDLYQSRKDGKCRRFAEGIVPIYGFNNYQGYIVNLIFKKWGSLMALGSLKLAAVDKVKRFEQRIGKIESLAAGFPDSRISILGRRGISSRLATRYKNSQRRSFLNRELLNTVPDYFQLEIYNPEALPADLTLVIRAEKGNKNTTPYQQRLQLATGMHCLRVPYDHIAPHIDPDEDHFISIIPNLDEQRHSMEIYLGTAAFIKAAHGEKPRTKVKTIKVAVWDLDNTIWDGILVEDGMDGLRLKPGIRDVMETLDQRGIINSVASKNNLEDAMAQLRRFELDHLIVFPQIDWTPKSKSLQKIIHDFNVGADTVAFIDDSAFEREEVSSINSDIRVFDASDYRRIIDLPEFNPKISSESSHRREFYLNQQRRDSFEASFSGDYVEFIRGCQMVMGIDRKQKNVDRIQELVQRTNQMNFSGNRYSREKLIELLDDTQLDSFSITCADRFGDYGTVGFCLVENDKPRLIDLMFSCRVQSKRVEHAFLQWLLEFYRKRGKQDFHAVYMKTEKNTPAGRVFEDLGFKIIDNKDNLYFYHYNLSQPVPQDNIVSIDYMD